MVADDRDRRPIPDPTTLTTDQLRREITALKEVIETRLDGMDKAVQLQHAVYNKYPDNLEATKNNMMELLSEKFDSINKQLVSRETRFIEITAAISKSTELALNSTRDANEKTEVSFTKQIDQLNQVVQVMGSGLNDKITDIKDRVNNREGAISGVKDNGGFLMGMIGLAIAAITVVVLMVRVITHT